MPYRKLDPQAAQLAAIRSTQCVEGVTHAWYLGFVAPEARLLIRPSGVPTPDHSVWTNDSGRETLFDQLSALAYFLPPFLPSPEERTQ